MARTGAEADRLLLGPAIGMEPRRHGPPASSAIRRLARETSARDKERKKNEKSVHGLSSWTTPNCTGGVCSGRRQALRPATAPGAAFRPLRSTRHPACCAICTMASCGGSHTGRAGGCSRSRARGGRDSRRGTQRPARAARACTCLARWVGCGLRAGAPAHPAVALLDTPLWRCRRGLLHTPLWRCRRGLGPRSRTDLPLPLCSGGHRRG